MHPAYAYFNRISIRISNDWVDSCPKHKNYEAHKYTIRYGLRYIIWSYKTLTQIQYKNESKPNTENKQLKDLGCIEYFDNWLSHMELVLVRTVLIVQCRGKMDLREA